MIFIYNLKYLFFVIVVLLCHDDLLIITLIVVSALVIYAYSLLLFSSILLAFYSTYFTYISLVRLDFYVYPLTLHKPLFTCMFWFSDESDNDLIFIFWNWRNWTSDTEVTGKFALEYWAASRITPRRTVQGCVCGSSCRPFITIMRPPLRELRLLAKLHCTYFITRRITNTGQRRSAQNNFTPPLIRHNNKIYSGYNHLRLIYNRFFWRPLILKIHWWLVFK